MSEDACAGFADFDKPFLLETDASKFGLGAQKQTDGHYHLVAYASSSVTTHESNYHSTKLDFLALKWPIAKQFQEYLLWKSFVFKTNNNMLTYIMTTPNLDVTQHHWVESLTRFTFSIEYQKGRDNAATDALSCVTSKLDAVTVKSILDGVIIGMTERADAYHPVVADTDEEVHKQVHETAILARAAQVHVDLHVTDWVTTQQEDSILKTVIEWISNWKVQALKHLLGEDADTKEGKTILREQRKLTLSRSSLSPPYSHWQTGGSFLICVPQGSLDSCHEWMSLRCWTPGPTANVMFAA